MKLSKSHAVKRGAVLLLFLITIVPASAFFSRNVYIFPKADNETGNFTETDTLQSVTDRGSSTTNDINVQGSIKAESIGINEDSPARLFIQQTDSGSADIVMSSDVTLNSRGVGLLIEASQAKAGSNSVRPGIYMFNSRTDTQGLAFPLFKVYTARNDNYVQNNGATFGALGSSGGDAFQYAYIGVNDRQSFNDHQFRFGADGLWINPPSAGFPPASSPRPLTVTGEVLIESPNYNDQLKLRRDSSIGGGVTWGLAPSSDFTTFSGKNSLRLLAGTSPIIAFTEDGDISTNGNFQTTNDVIAEGTVHANNYKSADGTLGWTGSCSGTLQVKNGLVVGCT